MIYFLRHGESESNALELFAGQKENSPLSPKGEQQAREAAESIRSQDLKFDRFVVSPQLRTKQTAEIIIDSLGLDKAIISYDERAVEYDMGDYTGTPKRGLWSNATC